MDDERAILLQKAEPAGRVRRVCVRGVLALLLLLIVGWVVVARSPITRMLLVPQIESYLSVIADADRVRVGLDGVVRIKGLRLAAPGFARPGEVVPDQARFFEIDQAEVFVDWGGFLVGKPRVNRVEVDGGMIRLSQSTETGQLNVAGLALLSGSTSDESLQLPQLIAEGITFEIGEHDPDGAYRKLRTMQVAGQLEPPTEEGLNVFHLTQTAESVSWSSGKPVPIPIINLFTVSGRFGPDGVRGVLRGVALEEWRPQDLPGPIRSVLNQLDLAGQIPEVSGELTPAGDFSLFMQVSGVGVTLPFSPGNGSDERARLTNTSGLIRVDTDGLYGDLTGELQGLNYSVTLDYFGLDAIAPFRCTLKTDFHLENDLGALVFAPEDVIEIFSWFGNPVADINAQILVSRDAPIDGVASDAQISGTLRFTNGTSAYKNFVYPFENLSGLARFTRDELTIDEITGEGPTGAQMTASLRFSPLGENSEADIRVSAEGIPIDQHLMDALSPARQEMVRQLFNEPRYLKLLSEALVLLPEERERLESLSKDLHAQIQALPESDPERAELEARRSQVDQSLRTPAFSFGGKASVVVTIHRDLGIVSNWTKDIRVTLNRVGVVPKYFPIPMVAHDVKLRIDDESVELSGGVFSGLTGGYAKVSTTVAMVDADGNSLPDALPTIHIEVEDMPIDPRLLAAIPGYHSDDPESGLGGILDRLNLTGFVDAVADIRPQDSGELGFEIIVPVDRLVATPIHPADRADDHPGIRLEPEAGRISAREDRVVIDISGKMIDLAGVEDPAPFNFLTEVEFIESKAGFGQRRRSRPGDQFGPPRPGPRLTIKAGVEGFGLSLPLEDLASVVSRSTAKRLAELRAQRRPQGRADVKALFEGYAEGTLEGLITVQGGRDLAVDVGGSRVRVDALDGSFELKTGVEPSMRFDSVAGEIRVNDDPSGSFEVNGVLPQATAGVAPERFHQANPQLWDRGLTVTLTRGSFESGLTDLTARSRLTPSVYEWFQGLDLRGGFWATLSIDPVRARVDPAVFPGTAVMPPLAVSGVIEPRSAKFVYRGTPIEMETVSGLIGFDGNEGWTDRLLAESRDWKIEMNGPWRTEPGYGFFIDTLMRVEVTTLDSQLKAMLPAPVVETLEAMEFDPVGPLLLRDVSLRMDIVADSDTPLYDMRGRVVLDDASGRLGVGFTEISGGFEFEATNRDGRSVFEINLGLDRARAAGLRLVGITGRIHNSGGEGVVGVEGLLAECHGGRLTASIQTDFNLSMHPYKVDLRLTGARAGPVFSDLGMRADRMPDLGEVPATQLTEALAAEQLAWADSGDRSRGILDGGVLVTGEILNKHAMHGRGRLVIEGGAIVAIPGLLPIIELSNLQMPSGSRLSRARAEFYMRGQTVFLDELSVSSNAIELYGGGTIKIPEVELDVWMRSRALKKIPVISDLLGGIRDEIVTAIVKGRPGAIRVSTEQFGGSKRVLRELLGNDAGPSRNRRDIGRGEIETRPSPRPVAPVSGDEGDYIIAGLPVQQEESSHER